MSHTVITYPHPPLAGRPPFATNEPEIIYQTPLPRERYPLSNEQDDIADSNYDNQTHEQNRQSGFTALGMGFLTGSMDDDSDDDDDVPPYTQGSKGASYNAATKKRPVSQVSVERAPLTIMAPKPGYAAPIAALGITHPQPAASPLGRQQSQMSMSPIVNPHFPGSPNFMPPSAPVTPLPLQPPLTPITPAFARPPKETFSRDVKFSSEPIMRGNSEDLLLPKRGDKGDDFWRRFSMIAKADNQTRYEKSTWLKQTQNGTSRLSRWVWITGIILLCLIGGGIGIGVYVSHQDDTSTSSAPDALGGSANEGVSITVVSTASADKPTSSGSTSPFVSPTNTVNKRYISMDAEATSIPHNIKKVAFGRAHKIDISF